MAEFSKILLPLLVVLFIFVKNSALAQQEDGFIYHGFKGVNLTLNGIASIHPNGLLELTNTSKQQIGQAFFPLLLPFNSSSKSNPSSLSFSTNFVFAMVPEAPSRGGHGIAFTISPSVDFKEATATQYLGLFNSSTLASSFNHLVAIELDTVRNPEFDDINDDHVGVDINNLTSIQSAPAGYFSEAEGRNVKFNLISGHPAQLWIDYNGVEKVLSVTLAPLRKKKPKQPLLSAKVDLSLVLLDHMYVGFSSSTGSVASNHYILGWSFNKSGEAQSLDISKLPSLPSPRTSKETVDLRIVVPLVAVLVLLATILAAFCILRRRYEEVHENWETQYGPQRFCYRDLYKATKGFKERGLLGYGGFGRVYKGVLRASNVEIAVKKISHDSKQGMKEFVAEIASMGRLRHRNLVQLLGYCRRKGELLLVYDYMPNGSLDKFLFSRDRPELNWEKRFKIIKGVASGLLYLHEEWEQVVLHRDVKASNVLLDADLNGRLGDFGLARFHDHGSTPQTTGVFGTIGYIAPELTRTGRATTSSDVFAFGTFMLEVACGRKPVELESPPEEMFLVDCVFECWKTGDILGRCDPRLDGNYIVEEMELVLKLGLLCAQRIPEARPGMRQVMQCLDGNGVLPEIPFQVAAIGLFPVSNQASTDGMTPNSTSSHNALPYSISDSDSILSGR